MVDLQLDWNHLPTYLQILLPNAQAGVGIKRPTASLTLCCLMSLVTCAVDHSRHTIRRRALMG